MTKDTPLDLVTYKPKDTEPAFIEACKRLGISKGGGIVAFVKEKSSNDWKRPEPGVSYPLGCHDEKYDILNVFCHHEHLSVDGQFGSWFEIVEYSNSETAAHVGLGFIDGELYELNGAALFYRDYDACWSPVTFLDDKQTAAVVRFFSDKEYPVMLCDGTDPLVFDLFKKSKEEKGFLYHAQDEAFYHKTQYPFNSVTHRVIYDILERGKSNKSNAQILSELDMFIKANYKNALALFKEANFLQESERHLTLLKVKPLNETARIINQHAESILATHQALLVENERKGLEQKAKPKALSFYHGGKEWIGKFEIGAKKSGGMEHGPGLYLTNGVETARHYAKGGGVVQMISISSDARLIDDVKVPKSEMFSFLRENSVRHYKKIIEDLNEHSERMGREDIHLEILVNLMVNYKSLTPSSAGPLNKFIVSKGVDISVFDAPMFNSYGGGRDQWVVVFNPDVVVSKQKVDMKNFDWSAPKLPVYQEQLTEIKAQSLGLANNSEQQERSALRLK